MKKYLNLTILAILLIAFSCGQKESRKNTTTSQKKTENLASATGGEFDVLVLGQNIDPQTKKLIDTNLRVIVPALPQVEELFYPVFADFNELSNIMLRNANILIIGPSGDKAIESFFKDEDLDMSLLDKEFSISENHWSSPQKIITISGKNTKQLAEAFIKNQDKIIQAFDENAKYRLHEITYAKRYSNKKTELLKERFGLSFNVPTHFDLIMEAYPGKRDSILKNYQVDQFVWFRTESRNTNQNILVYKTKYDPETLSDINNIFNLKNRVGKIVGSDKPGAYMSIDTTHYYFYPEKVKISGKDALKIRGIWQMENDYMGGPYINYVFADPEDNSIIYIDAFIFAAGEDKKPFIKRMEVILETLKFQ